jgi:hypothetical protein
MKALHRFNRRGTLQRAPERDVASDHRIGRPYIMVAAGFSLRSNAPIKGVATYRFH